MLKRLTSKKKKKKKKEKEAKEFLKVLEIQRASEERLLELGNSGELDCTQNEKGHKWKKQA